MTTAVVVGSGPNGLAAAIHLARQGVSVRVLEAKDTIGGGTRSSELTLPGLIHDDCSAFHPTGVASPFLQSLGLGDYGLRWLWPEIDLVHPLDSGSAGVLWRDIDRTAANMGEDGKAWQRMFGRLSTSFDELTGDVFRPIAHWPAHPVQLTKFGVNALAPAALTARRWKRPETRALFGGVAAHAFSSLHTPMSSSVGLMLTAAGHAYGWPVAEGGSRSITDAMASLLGKLGGTIETGVYVDSLDSLGSPDLVMLNVAPRAVLRIAGDRLPGRVARAYRRYKYGPAAFKVDFAVDGHVPWTNEHCRAAGTLHLGGTFEEVAEAEGQITRGVMPARPTVLVGQQYLADPSRSAGDINPIWAYAHVPHGYSGDATQAIIDQIERFAPGFRDRIVGQHVRSVAQIEQYNANYIGGDIGVGANTALQIAMRPRIGLDPYSTGIPGVYLCSSATAPGGGVHGMCGFNAAQSALKHLEN
ncbi:NAD(P)/FAD-dependent oxidoreductase [Rhodococcus sp. NPDC019627]|uniref:phytoene desaturase family protein n=1 Tax=unclassified Rhodococcus (in: high G+C Gram-positive bacteria) TaxID=192944 RepID=UPI003404C8CA